MFSGNIAVYFILQYFRLDERFFDGHIIKPLMNRVLEEWAVRECVWREKSKRVVFKVAVGLLGGEGGMF